MSDTILDKIKEYKLLEVAADKAKDVATQKAKNFMNKIT